MQFTIRCNYCNRKFLGNHNTIRINGTTVDVKCPYCNRHTIDNLSKFCEDQIGKTGPRLHRAKLMIELSRTICRLINNDRGN